VLASGGVSQASGRRPDTCQRGRIAWGCGDTDIPIRCGPLSRSPFAIETILRTSPRLPRISRVPESARSTSGAPRRPRRISPIHVPPHHTRPWPVRVPLHTNPHTMPTSMLCPGTPSIPVSLSGPCSYSPNNASSAAAATRGKIVASPEEALPAGHSVDWIVPIGRQGAVHA
jgi:hypothetical protein